MIPLFISLTGLIISIVTKKLGWKIIGGILIFTGGYFIGKGGKKRR